MKLEGVSSSQIYIKSVTGGNFYDALDTLLLMCCYEKDIWYRNLSTDKLTSCLWIPWQESQ